MAKANLTKEQKSRLLQHVEEEIDDLRAKNKVRMEEIARQGLGFNPIAHLAAQVDVLIAWTAPSPYARARFDLDVERVIENVLSPENVEEQKDQQARLQEQMRMVEQGRTETGLYVPEKASTLSVVPDTGQTLAVDPEATTLPANQTIAPPRPVPRIS